ncbi:MAG: hypothetical protein FD135_4050 [Comamonadaceae bacterium]|nr:MAG: hypothetical protein FD135_4050 [Comamonadaceae bacterium]
MTGIGAEADANGRTENTGDTAAGVSAALTDSDSDSVENRAYSSTSKGASRHKSAALVAKIRIKRWRELL